MGRYLRPMDMASRQDREQHLLAVDRLRHVEGPSLDHLRSLIALAPGFETTMTATLALSLWSTWSETKRTSEWLTLCWAVQIWRR